MSLDSPLMRMTQGQMRYLTQRQSVLAENIANIDTPNYQTKDVEKPDFEALVANQSAKMEMRATSPKHLTGTLSRGGAFAIETERNPLEVKPIRNGVVLEEEMAKISDTGAQYQISSSLFKKYTQMMRGTLGK